jgi:hypothetical protein
MKKIWHGAVFKPSFIANLPPEGSGDQFSFVSFCFYDRAKTAPSPAIGSQYRLHAIPMSSPF